MTTETETPKRIRIKRSKPILDLTLPDDQVEHAKRMIDYAKNQNPVIEKDIPMPDRIPGRGKTLKYNFGAMEVGDSYFRAGDPRKAANTLRQAAMNAKKRLRSEPSLADTRLHTVDFIVAERTQAVHGETGARVWRRE